MAILWAAVALATVCNGIWFAASASENRRLTWRPVFLAVVCSYLWMGANATILACLGVYSLPALTILLAGELALCLPFHHRHTGVGAKFRALLSVPLPVGLLVLLGVAAVLYFCFPTTYLSGGRDPGLYLINAIHIAETGSFQYASDPYMVQHYAALSGVARLDYPALYSAYEYGLTNDVGQVVPQFLPVLPAMLAVGYDLGGIGAAVRVNGVTGLLCLAAAYALVKPLYGGKAATLFTAFLLVNPAQLWGARITQTELLCQLLLFAALRVLWEGWRAKRTADAWLAGVLLGYGTFVRIDTYLLGAGFLVFVLYELACRRPHAGYLVRTAAVYAAFTAGSLAYGWVFSYPYFFEHWQAGVLAQVVVCNLVLLALCLAVWAVQRAFPRAVLPNVYQNIADSPRGMRVFCAALCVLFVFAYGVRPLLNPEDFNHRAAFEFCMYTSLLAIPLALYGLYRTFVRQGAAREAWLPFFFIGGSNLFVYLWRPSISADHVWASRRWVTAAIPFILALAAHGIAELPRLLRRVGCKMGGACRWTQRACAGIVAAYMLFQCRGFLLTPMWAGIEDTYAAVAQTLDDDTLYLTTNTETASVFKVVYHKNVRLLEDDPAALVRYLQENGSLHYLGSERDLKLLELDATLLAEGEVGGRMLRETYGEVPDSAEDRVYTCNQYEVTLRSLEEPQPIELTRFFTTPEISTYQEGRGIVGTGAEGHLLYGPYCTLLPGEYEVCFALETAPDAQLTLEAVAGNQQTLAAETAAGPTEMRLRFTVEDTLPEVEFRLHVDTPAQVTCTGVWVEKTA